MAFSFDKSLINQVQSANDIVDVISEHLNLAKKNREFVGICPFHDDHKPSMYVSPVKQIFKCFACGAGGDVVKFVQMRENLTFPQAIERLANRAGIKFEKKAFTPKSGESQELDQMTLTKVNSWAVGYFQKNLQSSEKGKLGRDYISQRKISDESVKKWKIGLAVGDNDMVKTAAAQKLTLKTLQQAGLAIGQRDGFADKFVNRLIFPITDATNRIVGFGGRTLVNDDAKYINSPTTALFDKSSCIYGLDVARHAIVSSDTAVAVEGYMDCIMAHQFGINNAVAAMGTSFTSGQGKIIRRYAKTLVLVFDSDVAGIEAANRAIEVGLGQYLDIKITSVPEGKDPCDYLLSSGKEAFENMLKNASDVFAYKWNRLKEEMNSGQTLSENKTAIDEFIHTVAAACISGNLDEVSKGLLVNKLSNIIHIDPKKIYSELNKKIGVQSNRSAEKKQQKFSNFDLGSGLAANAQREILEVLLNVPYLYRNVKDKLTENNFDVPEYNLIAKILFSTIEENQDAEIKDILLNIESAQTSNFITELCAEGEKKGNFNERLNGAMEALKRLSIEKQHQKIEDKTSLLKNVSQSKSNPHNIGMT